MATTSNAASGTSWEEISAEAQRDRRCEQRLKLPYPIEVFGFDQQGQYFTERSMTLNVSPRGCMLELQHQPEEQGVLAIRRVGRDGSRLQGHKAVLFEIRWARRSGRHWYVGASKLQSCDMWGLSAPSPDPGN
jgi:hypothetical protein